MATVPPPASDPRPAVEPNMLPVVVRPRAGPPAWVLVLVVVGIGVVLFAILDARRRALSSPAVRARAGEALSTPSEAPPLYVPPVPAPVLVAPQPLPAPTPAPAPYTPPPPPAIVYPQPAYTPPPPVAPAPPPTRTTTEPALVLDTTTGTPVQTAPNAAQSAAQQTGGRTAVAGTRTSAGVLANKPTTVPQGTLIPAVLETALDSTSPGLARALVSRDIRGFDGSRILIPRGSRLIGEYGSDTESGQKRMLVNWIRLIRPDGVTIAIGSPASDPLGQGGIRASVNSHFFARFTGAILQSALDVGVNLAARAADGQVIVALPGTLGSATRSPAPADIKPTLKVKAATSISVFVARDLDFTGVESR